ncbi:MAG TPA: GntR family transcriptional regulator [Microlunatus sp.]|nr:GntR family transcriptional regulator [Microlunatus sp.]
MSALYRQLYDKLRADIEQRRIAVGERLPSEAELVETHGVSAITIKRALDLLRDDGFIVRRPRLGTFVVSDVPTAARTDRPAGPSRPLIGFVVTNFDDTFGTKIIGGAVDDAQQQASLVINRSLGDAGVEDQLIRSLIDSGARAIILEPSSSTYVPPVVLELIAKSFPLVIIDRILDGIPVSTVGSDNVGGARAATEHLIELGHRRIGLVTTAGPVSTLDERRHGFLLANATASVDHDERNEYRGVESTRPFSDTPLEADLDALTEFVAARRELTAYVASEFNVALLLREACTRLGLEVPRHRSIVCFDHPDLYFDRSAFRFTHIRQDQDAIGRRAVQQALRQIADPGAIGKHTLPTTLVPGDSTRKLRTRKS